MDAKKTCVGCKQPVAANAPQGLCPECLIKAGLGTGVDIGPDSQSRPEIGGTRFVAPTVEELTAAFPELEILAFVGQGGMGAVYKARQKALDRIVALKVLPPDIGEDPAFADRFAREAKALAKLSNPNIVTLFEFGEVDGLYFFLMEFVDGVNLQHLLEAGRLSPREALAIVPQICDALQYAHDQGIVHRDIKPENILLDRQGRVKVADFGLAKLVRAGEDPSAGEGVAPASIVLTEVGKVMGTPQYMAPEQAQTPATVDHRADIYSLGVVLYQMLTGELPGKPMEPPSRRIHMDVRIDKIVMRALETTPELRYQTAAELRAQIETVDSPELGPPVSTSSAAKNSKRIAFDVAATCFFSGLVMGIPLISALPFRFNTDAAYLFLVAVMAVISPFAGRAASRALRRATLAGNAAGISILAGQLKALAVVALVLAVPVVAFGIFFMFGMLTESGGWNPATAEAVLVPLTWLGSLILPLAGWRLLQSGQSRGTTRSSVRADSPLSRLIKVGKGTLTTPEKLATADEQFFHALRYKGNLLLDDSQLTFSGAGTHTVIPLAIIHDLSIGHYPRIMNPMGLDFISVTYDESDGTKRVFIAPMAGLVGLPSHFNQVVADWFADIRDAATAATGRAPGHTPPDELGTPSSSPVVVGLLLLVLTAGLCAMLALMRRNVGTSPGSATGTLVFIAVMPTLAFLVPFVLGLFGRLRKHAPPAKRPGTTGKGRRGWTSAAIGVAALLVLLAAVPHAYRLWFPPKPTETVGGRPGITCVVDGGRGKVIEGQGSTDSELVMTVGGQKNSWRCGFLNNNRFTATVKRPAFGRGLNCLVRDSLGNVLLTLGNIEIGTMKSARARIVFRKGTLSPEPDGSFIVGEVRSETGPPLPITVRVKKRGASPPAKAAIPPKRLPASAGFGPENGSRSPVQ